MAQDIFDNSFDRSTVAMCRDLEKRFEETAKELNEKEGADPEKNQRSYQTVRDIALFVFTGQRAEQKVQYLQAIQERKERRERLLASAVPKAGIPCQNCSETLTFEFKTDWTDDNDRERVLLFYVCPNKCLPKRAFFEDGSEYISKPTLCNKCNGETESTAKRNGSITKIIWKCGTCAHQEIDEHDFSQDRNDETGLDPSFEDDRTKYCLDEEGLSKYRDFVQSMKSFSRIMEESKAREEDTATNQRMQTLKRLRVASLEKHIQEPLEETGMSRIELSQPTNDRGFKVKITMLDTHEEREDQESKKIVQNILTKKLHETNWRIVKSSFECTLGAVSGDLRGYTSDEELRKVVEHENSTNKKRTRF